MCTIVSYTSSSTLVPKRSKLQCEGSKSFAMETAKRLFNQRKWIGYDVLDAKGTLLFTSLRSKCPNE